MKHIPNILSSIRILLIPLFVWLMWKDNTTMAAAVLLASGLTDFLDGALARRFGWISPLGKVLDPVADKATQLTVCVMMLLRLRHLWPFFALMFFKDFVMLVCGGYLLKNKVKLDGARWFGKVSTFAFYAVMVVLVFVPTLPSWLVITLLSVITACAYISGLLYIPQFIAYRKSIGSEETGAAQAGTETPKS